MTEKQKIARMRNLAKAKVIGMKDLTKDLLGSDNLTVQEKASLKTILLKLDRILISW